VLRQRKLAKFYKLIANGDVLVFWENSSGGGDDERELMGQMAATWLTDLPLPLFTYRQTY